MSEFKMVRPATFPGNNLTSNVPETGAQHSLAATYAKGAKVVDISGTGATHHEYESLVDGNTGNALEDATKWLDLGATNRWRMFDDVNGTLTTSPTGIDFSRTIEGRVDALGLLNLEGEEVQVTMTVAGEVVYDRTYNLVSTENISDWFAYFSEEVVYKADLVLIDLPLFINPTVRVQIRSDAGPAAVGQVVLGLTRTLGETVYGGASVGIRDFSKAEENEEFGTISLKKRAWRKRGDFKIVMPEATADSVARLLADYRATNLLWIGAETHGSTIIFGWVRDWGIDFVLYGQAHGTLQIGGII